MMKPLLAITMGDPAGIGPEVLVKALASGVVQDQARVFVIGSEAALQVAMEEAGCGFEVHVVGEVESVTDQPGVHLLDPFGSIAGLVRGEPSALGGGASVSYFERAVTDAMEGKIDGIVTCPINKVAVQMAGFHNDIGHQEILARLTNAPLTATLLMTPGLKVAHLSTHLSLFDAVAYVRRPILIDTLTLTHEHLQRWGCINPVIAVAALNPHGGEAGMLGREEIEEIGPAIETLQARGLDVRGPFPADSVFNRAIDGEFDAVLALFHDQGHIPIKVHNFSGSVTATLGIPFVRTSVDHGTAYDIVGKSRAEHEGLEQAIRAATLMLRGQLQDF